MNIHQFYKKHKGKIRPTILLLLTFSLFKVLAYLAPLGINETVNSILKFGEFEYSLNLGQMLMGALSMGFSGTYAYFVVKNERKNLTPIFHLHFFILTIILITFTLLFPSLLKNLYFGAVITGVAFAEQIFLSSILKLSGRNKTAVIVDTSVYIIMFGIIILCYLQLLSFSIELWFTTLLLGLCATSLFYHAKKTNGWKHLDKSDFLALYKFGGLIVITGPLLVLITGSTRIYIEYFSGFEDVGIYSFYFRLASFVLIFSRVLIILLFRKMYLEEHSKLDSYISMSMIGLFVMSIIIYFLLPIILANVFPNYEMSDNESNTIYLICSFQVIFWINTSFFEPIIQRENSMKQFILLLFICLTALVSSLFLLGHLKLLSLQNIIWMNTLVIFLLVCGQLILLARKKILYRKSFFVNLIIGGVFLLTLLSRVL